MARADTGEKLGPVKAALSFLKKAGATLIVVFLVGMMALTFSSQPMDEIMAILTGGSRYGEFNGEDISQRNYAFADRQCRDRFRDIPEIPAFFLGQCIEGQIQGLYVLPSLAERMGLEATEEEVEKTLVENAKFAFDQQAMNTLPEDRLSLQELYRQQLQMMPLDLRLRIESATRAESILYGDVHIPVQLTGSLAKPNTVQLDLTILRYSEVDLLRLIDAQVDQSLAGKERTEAKQTKLGELKQQLGTLKPEERSIDEISRLTGTTPLRIAGQTLNGLSATRLPDGTATNLADADFILSLAKDRSALHGPYQDGQYTFYVQVNNIRTGGNVIEDAQKYQSDIMRAFSQYILKQESVRGDFRVALPEGATMPEGMPGAVPWVAGGNA